MSNKSPKEHPLAEHTGPASAQLLQLANENPARVIPPQLGAAPACCRAPYQLHGAVVLLPAPQHHAHGPAGTCRARGRPRVSPGRAGGVALRPCPGTGTAGPGGPAAPGEDPEPLGAGATGPGRDLAQRRGTRGKREYRDLTECRAAFWQDA